MLNFLTDIAFPIALLIFVVGMIARIILYVKGLDWRLERVAYSKQMGRGIPGALCSIVAWLIPGGTHGWRKQPLMTLGFFLLHAGAIALPLFLVGHTVLLENALGISLPSLPMGAADVLTIAALVGLVILTVRRFTVPEARALTGFKEWMVLILTIVPFVSGYFATHSPSDMWTIVHIVSGIVFLVVAPFTKLSHIVLFFMSRAQVGMDFAIKRGGASRGPVFPW